MEAAAQGKAVLFGPNMFNFKEAAAFLLETGGGLEVKDARDFVDKAGRLLNNKEERDRRGKIALDVVRANKGAVERNVELMEKYLNLSVEITPT